MIHYETYDDLYLGEMVFKDVSLDRNVKLKNAYSLNVGDWNYRHSNLEEEKAAYEKLCNYVGLKSNLTLIGRLYQLFLNLLKNVFKSKFHSHGTR